MKEKNKKIDWDKKNLLDFWKIINFIVELSIEILNKKIINENIIKLNKKIINITIS